MHVTILGASRFGVATVKRLVADGHEAVLIDADKAVLDDLANDLDCGMIHGDGTLPSTLRDAFGDGSDALVALTNEDDVNILASVVGRSVGYERVIPQILRPELLSIVEELELDDTITPHESVARSIVAALTQHSEMDTDLTLHRELRLMTLKVPPAHGGRTPADLDLPGSARPVALVSGKTEALADGTTQMSAGDRIMFAVEAEDADALEALFAEG